MLAYLAKFQELIQKLLFENGFSLDIEALVALSSSKTTYNYK